jgi:hypothetical protein
MKWFQLSLIAKRCQGRTSYNEILYKSNFKYSPNVGNLIDGVTVSVLSSSVVDRGFETRSGETKDYKISLQVDMLLHSDTLFWLRANKSLLFLLNAACLAKKQQIPIL